MDDIWYVGFMSKYRKVTYHSYAKEEVDGKNVQQITSRYEIKFIAVTYTLDNLKTFKQKIKSNLTPDLLNSKYREQNKTNPMFGHCVVVTQALYYLFDTDKLIPYRAEDSKGEIHWWIQDGKKIIDIVKSQYTLQGLTPPYDNKKPLTNFSQKKNCNQAPCYWIGGWQGRMRKGTLKLLERVIDCKVKTY